MENILIGAVIGGFAGALAVLVLALLQKPKVCPECGTAAPRFRKPSSLGQMLWGGWTCAQCGCAFDKQGRKIEQ
jgi:transposase-like protein